MGMEHWWNDTDKGKLRYWEGNLSQCHCVHQKCHTEWPWNEPGLPRLKPERPARTSHRAEYKDHPNARPPLQCAQYSVAPISFFILAGSVIQHNRRERRTWKDRVILTLHAKRAVLFTSAPPNTKVTICTTDAVCDMPRKTKQSERAVVLLSSYRHMPAATAALQDRLQCINLSSGADLT